MRIGVIGVGRIGTLHAHTIARSPLVDELVISDVNGARAAEVADALRATGSAATVLVATDVGDVIGADLDALVICTGTATHPELILQATAAGIPTFCEKPVAPDLRSAYEVAARVRTSGVPVHIGFQRRFDPGFMAARESVADGRLGYVHTIRACTLDISPPAATYIPESGGIFRDCSIHDIDALRYVSGREVVEVFAFGSILSGAPVFAEAQDIDTAAAVLTLDDGALALLSAARYNAAGYDVRLEVHGSKASVAVGLDDRMPLRSVEQGVVWPAGPASAGFLERFEAAYVAEMEAFLQVATGSMSTPCNVDDGLAAELIAEACDRSRREHRPVTIAEIASELTTSLVEHVV